MIREQLRAGVRSAIQLANAARRYEDQQQLENALRVYTESIQKLLENYKKGKIDFCFFVAYCS